MSDEAATEAPADTTESNDGSGMSAQELYEAAEKQADAYERAKGVNFDEMMGLTEPEAEKPAAKTKPEAKADDGDPEQPKDPDVEGKVTVEERAKFREEKRKARKRIEEERAELMQQRQRAEQELGQRYAPAFEMMKAWESGDLDLFAQKLTGDEKASWTSLNDEALRAINTPGYQRMREMERRLREKERREQEAEQHQRMTAQQQKQAEAQRRWREDLQKNFQEHEDEALQEFADDPQFISGVFRMQQEHWDGRETIDAEEAGYRVIADAAKLYEDLGAKLRAAARSEKVRKRLGDRAALFQPEQGDRDTETPEGPKGQADRSSRKSSERRGGRKPPKTVSQSKAQEAAPVGEFEDDAQWKAYWNRKAPQMLADG